MSAVVPVNFDDRIPSQWFEILITKNFHARATKTQNRWFFSITHSRPILWNDYRYAFYYERVHVSYLVLEEIEISNDRCAEFNHLFYVTKAKISGIRFTKCNITCDKEIFYNFLYRLKASSFSFDGITGMNYFTDEFYDQRWFRRAEQLCIENVPTSMRDDQLKRSKLNTLIARNVIGLTWKSVGYLYTEWLNGRRILLHFDVHPITGEPPHMDPAQLVSGNRYLVDNTNDVSRIIIVTPHHFGLYFPLESSATAVQHVDEESYRKNHPEFHSCPPISES